MDKLKNILRFVVPGLVALAVAVMWAVKTAPLKSGGPDLDFSLHASSVDLDAWREHGVPIIITFGASNCPACREFLPVLEGLNAELSGRAVIKYIDSGKNPRASKDFPFQYIPAQFFYDKDGRPAKFANAGTLGIKMFAGKNGGEHIFSMHEGFLEKEQVLALLTEMGL